MKFVQECVHCFHKGIVESSTAKEVRKGLNSCRWLLISIEKCYKREDAYFYFSLKKTKKNKNMFYHIPKIKLRENARRGNFVLKILNNYISKMENILQVRICILNLPFYPNILPLTAILFKKWISLKK